MSDFLASVVGVSMGVMHAALDGTTLTICHGDARELGWVAPGSIHLAMTSPPYWTLKEYPRREGQLGLVEDYGAFGLVGVVAGDPLRHRHVLGFDKCGGTLSNSGSAYSS